ncbi:DUF1616 domain-containing protein [Candidatus Micrarchaeota archaeon]|nr:DUF1616 domain-containing protein [Candidatus Micrarchaeota archaeon]MBU2477041.1 DUF1616 domain-containing protein [Candidatus Micrarchaeota archaeon]
MDLTDDKMDDFLFKGLVIVLIVILGILLVYSYTQVKPETFTQVYLIPDKIVHETAVDELVPVEFEIDNREGKTVEYTYMISLQEPNSSEKTNLIVEKTVVVEDNEKKRIIEQVPVLVISSPFLDDYLEEKKKVLIEVSKPGMEEPYSVWFWIKVK